MHAIQVARIEAQVPALEGPAASAPLHPLFHDKRHLLHKRMERWLRLQQFVYGLPDDYAYAMRLTDTRGETQCRTLVRMGWLTWYGAARGGDRQHALALALLETSEALCANAYQAFFHSVKRSFRRVWRALRAKPAMKLPETKVEAENLLAG